MTNPRITRTYGPIHFEDLDPHRFEDLIRELIYDYKDWQSIEATGRSGSDQGFDIRTYEKVEIISHSEDENNEEVEEVHPMEGNLWMIQGKREKEIGPKKIRTILLDINSKNPPYGYILAASTNFSKESYDVFREELRKKGVMEFYLWGKAELEDMLHLPKNDRILFTFFGISLVSKRKTRITEVRSIVTIKNKFFRIVEGDYNNFYKKILVRDLKDTEYPYKSKYPDFEINPRWKVFFAFSQHPLGILCHNHEYFAFIDKEKKEWDYTSYVDLSYSDEEDDKLRQMDFEKRILVTDFWDFLPNKNKTYLFIDSLIRYSDILLIDDKGDVSNDFPHIFVDFYGEQAPFSGSIRTLKIENEEINLDEDYKRVNVFPVKFKKAKLNNKYKVKKILLNPEALKAFEENQLDSIFSTDEKYRFINNRDVIQIENNESKEEYIQITHKYKASIKTVLEQSRNYYKTNKAIELQIGKLLSNDEEIYVYEFKRIYK